MRVLISFLGRGKAGDVRGERRYENATYRFEDGALESTPYFGLALARRLKPDCVVFLGTA